MKTIKIVSSFACCFILTLFILIIFIEDPDKKRFDETVETLMAQNEWSTVEEVMEAFPVLKDIQLKMKRISYLQSRIHSITGGPAPNVTTDESLKLKDYRHEIQLLRNRIKKELAQFETRSTESMVGKTIVKQ